MNVYIVLLIHLFAVSYFVLRTEIILKLTLINKRHFLYKWIKNTVKFTQTSFSTTQRQERGFTAAWKRFKQSNIFKMPWGTNSSF